MGGNNYTSLLLVKLLELYVIHLWWLYSVFARKMPW